MLALSKLVFIEIFRKKDFYVAGILILAVLFYASQMSFYDVDSIGRYLREIGLGLIFLFSVVLTVPLAARQYPSERDSRTLLVLMAKPVSRLQFVLGKFAGSACAGIACFLAFYGLFLALVYLRGEPLPGMAAAQTAYLFCLNLVLVAAMAAAFSYYLTFAANVTLTLVLYLLISIYGAGLAESAEGLFWLSRLIAKAVYFGMPHFEFFDMRQRLIHDWGAISPGLLLFLTAYAAVYSGVFVGLGWLRFRKQPL